MSRAVAAFDLGGTHVSAGRVDLDRARVDEWVRIALPATADRETLLERILQAVTDVVGDADAVGFAVPGPFDYARGVSLIEHKLQALHGADLRSPVARRLGLSLDAVVFVNDADAFVLGEWWAGAATGCRRVVGATLGSGLGSAFLANGRIVDSGPEVPPAGEIHRLSLDDRPVEASVSRAAVIEQYGVPGVDVEEIAIRARGGDARAVAAFHHVAASLGRVFEPWLASFGATCFVVGGSIAAAWDLLYPGLRASLEHLDRLEIARASHLDHAALLGAAYYAAERRRAPSLPPRRLHELTVAEARAAQAAEPVIPPGEMVGVDALDLVGPVPIRLFRPPTSEPLPLCVWLPGGGWVLDTMAAAEPACRRIAAEAHCAVAAVRYRLAPEHRFPIPVDDSLAATLWLLERASSLDLDPRRVAIGGTSAGGNLAAAVTLLARGRGDVDLAAQLLVYPLLLFDPTRPLDAASVEAGFDQRDVDWCWSHYLPTPDDGADPLTSPLLADDLTGLPRALVVTAELDPLRDEAERYASRLRKSGVPVELVQFDGVAHGFFSLAGVLDAADRAQLAAIDALRAAFSAPVSNVRRRRPAGPR